MNATMIATMKRFSPVIMPACLILSMTGALRVGTAIKDATSSKPTSSRMAMNAHFNKTESTFVRLVKVRTLIEQGQDNAALSEIAALRNQPITVQGNLFRNEALNHFSPQSLLTGFGHALAIRSRQLKGAGNDAIALQYIQALYSIGDNILASKSPIFDELEMVHFFHGLATQTEATLYPDTVLAQSRNESSQMNALRTLWNRRIRPQLQPRPGETISLENEQYLAAQLITEYRDEWSRIHPSDV